MRTSRNVGQVRQRSGNGRTHAKWSTATGTHAAVVLGARNLGAAITRDLLDRGLRVATVARTRADLDPLAGDGASQREAYVHYLRTRVRAREALVESIEELRHAA
jgi:NAD(P)-dependent dehydrogenase (short-subunit alcohol dehydrogenase family)